MSCGDIGMLEGGTIKSSTILTSEIINSNVQGSTIDGAAVTNLVSIDEPSIQKIVDEIAKLPKDKLKALADALREELVITPLPEPEVTEDAKLPTSMVGSREKSLGAPDVWAAYGDYALPLYNKK